MNDIPLNSIVQHVDHGRIGNVIRVHPGKLDSQRYTVYDVLWVKSRNGMKLYEPYESNGLDVSSLRVEP